VEGNLNELASLLRQLEDQQNRLRAQLDEENAAERLKEIDFSTIGLSIVTELSALSKFCARFSRQNLNLGVVGIARQGKSRLL